MNNVEKIRAIGKDYPTEKIIELLRKHLPCIHEMDCETCRHKEDCAAFACILAADALGRSIDK